jgi:serine/threonine protein kinase
MSDIPNCTFILKNYNQCKNKCNKELNNIPYCTRHYNKLILEFNQSTSINKQESSNKLDSVELNYSDLNLFNIQKITDILKSIKRFENYSNLEYINSGTYVDVYKIKINNKLYALKYQDLSDKKNMLYYEYLLLSKHFIKHENIVEVYSYYFKTKQYALLLVEFIPTQLDTITYKSEDLIKNLGIQLINGIKFIHSKKYLYIDLKPDNIMIKNKIVKLIDFNLCIKYIDSYSKYYPNEKLKSRQGNDLYSSRNINSGFRGVRIDDIESILYILMDLLQIDEFKSIKQSKQIKVIIDKKKYLFNQTYNFKFINEFIKEINIYINNDTINNKLQNKTIIYDNFIKILKL